MRVTRHARAAFTLVELLVVIGIIAVLIGILLPTLSRARDSAKTAQCMSNLRQIGQAFAMYVNDSKGWICPAYIEPINGGGNGVESWGTILVNRRYLPAPKQDTMPTLEQESSNNAGNSVFYCPNGTNLKHDLNNASGPDDPSPVDPEDPVNTWFWRRTSRETGIQIDHWYAANADENSTNPNVQARWPMRSLHLANAQGMIDGGPLTRTNHIKKSAETAMIVDGLRVVSGLPQRISARHNGRKMTNILMADWHVECLPSKSLPHKVGNTNPLGANQVPLLSDKYPHPKWRMEQQR